MLRWLPMRGDGSQKSLDVPLHQKMGSLFTQAPAGVEHEETATDVGLGPRQEPQDKLTFLEDELEGSREWRFRVEAETLPGETVCVTGDCRSLGGWASSGVLQLSQETSNVWSSMVAIPAKRDVQYRYAVCVIIQPDGHMITDTHIIVRHWETHTIPRIVTAKAGSNVEESDVLDVYGQHAHYRKVDRGWLTTNTVIQLKLHGKLLVFWKKKLEGRKMYVKVSPVNLARKQSQEVVSPIENIDESMDTHDGPEEPNLWPIAEIAAMNEEDRTFHLQNQFGNACTSDDFVIFNISVLFPETVAYLVDYYTYNSRATDGDPPYHVGFSYLLPSVLRSSEGQVIVPITSVKHRPIGQLTVEYVVVRPIPDMDCDMSVSYSRVWKESWAGLDVGHRGSGTSFKGQPNQCAEIRENTIASLKKAASSGADLVEFDVQLSKDLVPVLYHDFHVCIAMKRKKQLEEPDMLELPLKDLTLNQLHLLKGNSTLSGLSKVFHFCQLSFCGVYHLAERSSNRVFSNEDEDDHQPFPTLQQALETLDPHTGFNIEIKWNMQLQDGTYEVYHPFDLNMYLDTVLKVVLRHAGTRKIVFSCFHPDVCTMIRLKQNKYPVMFLTQGVTDKYPPYQDPRAQSIPMAVHHAKATDILGINVHTEDILRDPSQVKLVLDSGLILFCWGDDNNDMDTIQHLKKLGLHGIIYDKIDQVSRKEVKESIFLVEAREAQRELMKVAENPSETPVTSVFPPMNYTFNLEAARESLKTMSTSSFLSDVQPDDDQERTPCNGNS